MSYNDDKGCKWLTERNWIIPFIWRGPFAIQECLLYSQPFGFNQVNVLTGKVNKTARYQNCKIINENLDCKDRLTEEEFISQEKELKLEKLLK